MFFGPTLKEDTRGQDVETVSELAGLAQVDGEREQEYT